MRRSLLIFGIVFALSNIEMGSKSNLLLAQVHFGDAHAGLAVHGTGDAAALGQLAAQLYKGANDDLAKWIEQGNKNKLDAAKPADVAKNYVQIQQIARAGKHLSGYGEPAGPDYIARSTVLAATHASLFQTYKNSIVAQQYANLCRQQLAKDAKKRQKELESIGKLIQAKKFVEAEKEMDAALDYLDSLVIYLTPDEVPPITRPFGELKAHIDGPARQLRMAHGQKILAAARDGMKAEGAIALEVFAKAAAALKSSASVDLNGQMATGPQIIGLLENTLTGEHAAMLRRRAIEMARASALEQSTETPERKAIEDQYASVSKQLLALIPAIILADAARAGESDAPALYEQHLAAASALLIKMAGDAPKVEVRSALNNLAAKSAVLAAEVANEEASCAEYLRWQKRTAAALAKAKATEFPPLSQVFVTGASVDEKTFVDGLFSHTGSLPACMFWGASPRIIATVQPKLAGKTVTVANVFPLESGGQGVTRYADRTVAMIALPDFSPQAEILNKGMLGEGRTPKSLEAAMAVDATKRGWLRGAGGTIEDLFLEAVLTRFAKTPAAIAHLSPIGGWNEEPKEPLMRHALGRFVIKPNWYQGEYFFAVSQ
jgi:hypothetical protein